MNNTYSLIISQSERAWNFQWARTLFALERRLGADERLAHLRSYAINMPAAAAATDEAPSADAPHFLPGLMIIKRSGWTRAERRRKIVGLWQVSASVRLTSQRSNLAKLTCHLMPPKAATRRVLDGRGATC